MLTLLFLVSTALGLSLGAAAFVLGGPAFLGLGFVLLLLVLGASMMIVNAGDETDTPAE